jgi:chromosomal replication initiation ATPase DnaA
MWLVRRVGRMTLSQLADAAGGLDYAAVAVALSRLAHRMERDAELARTLRELERKLLPV